MKNFNRLIEECLSEITSIGIIPGEIEKWEINRRAKKRWGQCRKQKSGTYIIQISARLLEDDKVSEEACKTTIIHEILHTCEDGMKHTGKWKEYASRMNAAYGYDIKRTTSATEKGLEPQKTIQRPAKYVFRCRYCWHVVTKTRRCKFTHYYRNYSCVFCGRKHAYQKC